MAEGSMASAASRKSELKLTGVARASLEELLLDYEDFLRQRGLRLWRKDSPEALEVRGRYQARRQTRGDHWGMRCAEQREEITLAARRKTFRRCQCLKCRRFVKIMAMCAALAALITSWSRTEPPGWITAVIPASAATSIPSGNGK